MRLTRSIFLAFCLFSSLGYSQTVEKADPSQYAQISQEPAAVTFTPPAGWRAADPKELSPSVKAMVIGKSKTNFPPSINISMHPYAGTLKQYLKMIKSENAALRAEWKDLGSIRTLAGDASLSQVDEKTEWGEIRLMQTILVKNGFAYILTAASTKNEFAGFYKDFFNSMGSLTINPTVYEMVSDKKQRTHLEASVANLKKEWQSLLLKKKETAPEGSPQAIRQELFKSEEFQNNFWNSFKAMLTREFTDMTLQWQDFLLNKLQNELAS